MLLDRDVRSLDIPAEALEPALLTLVGIGGSVRSFVLRDVETTFASDEGDFVLRQELWVAQHDLDRLPPEEVARILRLPYRCRAGSHQPLSLHLRLSSRTSATGAHVIFYVGDKHA